MSAVLEAEGVTLQQYNVLRILRGAGAESSDARDRRADDRAGAGDHPAAGPAGEQAAGEPGALPADRRQVTCRIAKPGLVLLSGLDPVVDQLDDSMLGDLTPAELKQLIRLLDRIRAPMDRLRTGIGRTNGKIHTYLTNHLLTRHPIPKGTLP